MLTPRVVVGVFAGLRVGIGVAVAIAPDRTGTAEVASAGATLMTRSFAIREVVLGVGGLLCVARDDGPSALRTWAALGVLTDIGDLTASVASARGGHRSARLAAVAAAMGLVAEGWAFAESRVSPSPSTAFTL
jgi:hypothetical protein